MSFLGELREFFFLEFPSKTFATFNDHNKMCQKLLANFNEHLQFFAEMQGELRTFGIIVRIQGFKEFQGGARNLRSFKEFKEWWDPCIRYHKS